MMTLPIKENEIYTGKIIDTTMLGDGIVKIDGYTIFIKGGVSGDTVEYSPYKCSKKYAKANIINIIESSNHRQKPFCQHYNECGGCNLQQVDYTYQLDIKSNAVKTALKRVLPQDIDVDIIGIVNPYDYRNKTTYSIEYADGIKIGFNKSGTHNVTDTPMCRVQHASALETQRCIKRFYKKHPNDNAYVKKVVSRYSVSNDQHMILIKGRNLKRLCDYVESCLSPTSLYTQSFSGDYKLYSGNKYIHESIDNIEFALSPGSFFQVNYEGAKRMVDVVSTMIKSTQTQSLVDAYCGAGFFSLTMAKYVKQVTGIELYKPAVIDARNNARHNHIKNALFLHGKAEEVLGEIISEGNRPDTIIVDPPRKGCDKALLTSIIDSGIKNIIYISCNPFTLARDLEILCNDEYEIKVVKAIDMFPWTGHVECVVGLYRED